MHFLDNFAVKPFRHERFFEETEGASTEPHGAFELAKVAQLLTEKDPASALQDWPTIEAATATDTGTAVEVRVTVNADPDIAHVRVYGAQSPNREYNDIDQKSWRVVELSREADGSRTWSGSIQLSGNLQIAWYAEVEELLSVGQKTIPRRHVTPIRFLRAACPATVRIFLQTVFLR